MRGTSSIAFKACRLSSVVAPLLALMRPLNRQLTYSDERIEHLPVQDPRVPRLRSIPSVGPVTAAAFIAAIDDAQRFRHAHQLEAYLCPASTAAARPRRGPITKAGHSRTRWLLIQAAVSILRRRPPQAEELPPLQGLAPSPAGAAGSDEDSRRDEAMTAPREMVSADLVNRLRGIVAGKLRDRAEIDDVVQEVLIKIVRDGDAVSPDRFMGLAKAGDLHDRQRRVPRQ